MKLDCWEMASTLKAFGLELEGKELIKIVFFILLYVLDAFSVKQWCFIMLYM
jgi:hypothetical protein